MIGLTCGVPQVPSEELRDSLVDSTAQSIAGTYRKHSGFAAFPTSIVAWAPRRNDGTGIGSENDLRRTAVGR